MAKSSAGGDRPETLEAHAVDVAFRGVVALQGVTMTLASRGDPRADRPKRSR